jgi:hypothetical protein
MTRKLFSYALSFLFVLALTSAKHIRQEPAGATTQKPVYCAMEFDITNSSTSATIAWTQVKKSTQRSGLSTTNITAGNSYYFGSIPLTSGVFSTIQMSIQLAAPHNGGRLRIVDAHGLVACVDIAPNQTSVVTVTEFYAECGNFVHMYFEDASC